MLTFWTVRQTLLFDMKWSIYMLYTAHNCHGKLKVSRQNQKAHGKTKNSQQNKKLTANQTPEKGVVSVGPGH